MSRDDTPRYHSEPSGMMGAKTPEELGLPWGRGEVRYYDPVFHAGCAYCVSKKWRPCRFPRLCRIENASYVVDWESKEGRLSANETEYWVVKRSFLSVDAIQKSASQRLHYRSLQALSGAAKGRGVRTYCM